MKARPNRKTDVENSFPEHWATHSSASLPLWIDCVNYCQPPLQDGDLAEGYVQQPQKVIGTQNNPQIGCNGWANTRSYWFVLKRKPKKAPWAKEILQNKAPQSRRRWQIGFCQILSKEIKELLGNSCFVFSNNSRKCELYEKRDSRWDDKILDWDEKG